MDKTIATYNRIARQYHEQHRVSCWLEELVAFKQNLPGKRILEIGCGPGRDAAFFDGYQYIGIDASEEMLTIARTQNPQLHFMQMDYRQLDFAPASFDGFLALASLLHCQKKDMLPVLDTLRSLASRSIGFITVKEGFGERYVNDRYFAFYQGQEFSVLLEQSGFSITSAYKRRIGTTDWLCFFVQ